MSNDWSKPDPPMPPGLKPEVLGFRCDPGATSTLGALETHPKVTASIVHAANGEMVSLRFNKEMEIKRSRFMVSSEFVADIANPRPDVGVQCKSLIFQGHGIALMALRFVSVNVFDECLKYGVE